MKSMNLISFLEAKNTLEPEQFNRYLAYFGVAMKESECEDICQFVNVLLSKGQGSDQLSEFFVGYRIPQISKEFDLLRFGHSYNINIELKRRKIDQEKIKNQLIRNRYYLSALEVPVRVYSFVAETQDVYTLDEGDDQLITTDLEELIGVIEDQKYKIIDNIDSLFKPSVYLVSPLNSTEKFLSGNYFLNSNQEEIKNGIKKIFADNSVPFIAIEGKPGTGKTLLTYDIAKYYMSKGWNVCIFHCGFLAEGHVILRENHDWEIYPIREINTVLQQSYDLLIVDETQRIYTDQLELIIDYVIKRKTKCIFSYDPEQVLSIAESSRNIAQKIENLPHQKYELSKKIRTNKEIASFIINLFDKSKRNNNMKYDNIYVQYFDSSTSLKNYLMYLRNNGWKVIDYTSSKFYTLSYDDYQLNEKNAHEVIGQEFDKVAAVISQHFHYDDNGKLMSVNEPGAPRYRLDKMLYQILTRARQEIMVIIYKNQPLLEACLEILERTKG